ncbi:hypothetical protein DIE03_20105 [Burkholderia sp. Bp8992]|uniref:hypothetical protein n=1 Tax=Burkholderia sp. Bp8992 TaxID=2184554 RepID=UPI000F5863D6|nr:hypothetical protein [Burkholderia sp. Bp8992]RQS28008.1 hypothetical protein DIE03_20105 [Burkholderia sp. Bp8992]
MRTPLSDAAWRKAWNDLCMVGDPDLAPPWVRLVVECAAFALQERKQVRLRPRPAFDAKRCAANDFD